MELVLIFLGLILLGLSIISIIDILYKIIVLKKLQKISEVIRETIIIIISQLLDFTVLIYAINDISRDAVFIVDKASTAHDFSLLDAMIYSSSCYFSLSSLCCDYIKPVPLLGTVLTNMICITGYFIIAVIISVLFSYTISGNYKKGDTSAEIIEETYYRLCIVSSYLANTDNAQHILIEYFTQFPFTENKLNSPPATGSRLYLHLINRTNKAQNLISNMQKEIMEKRNISQDKLKEWQNIVNQKRDNIFNMIKIMDGK